MGPLVNPLEDTAFKCYMKENQLASNFSSVLDVNKRKSNGCQFLKDCANFNFRIETEDSIQVELIVIIFCVLSEICFHGY